MKVSTYTFVCVGLLTLALATAAWWVERAPVKPFEQEVVRAELIEQGPQSAAALAQYPDAAVRVFSLYGQTPELTEALRRFGHNQLVPIVDRCLRGGDGFIEMGNSFNQIVSSLAQLHWPKPAALTAEECGWQAILLTLSIGNDFLGQFVIDSAGEARRLPGSSVLAAAKGAAGGGLQGLEKKLVLGEATGWRDWGAAALNVTVLGAAARSVSLVAKARLAAAAARPAMAVRVGVAGEGLAAFARAAAPRIAKYATLGGIAYLAVYHPAVISSAVRTLAEVIGADPVVLQMVAWGAILFLPAWLVVSALFMARQAVRVLAWPFRSRRFRPANPLGGPGLPAAAA